MVPVREAIPGDVHAIVRVYVDSWNAGFGARMPEIRVDDARIERWRGDLGSETPSRWWLYEDDGRVMGFVGIGPCRDPEDSALGELDTIAVAPDCWRRGVGSALMATALEELAAAGYQSAALWTLAEYPRGESFYLKHGWRRHGASRSEGAQVRYDHGLAGS